MTQQMRYRRRIKLIKPRLQIRLVGTFMGISALSFLLQGLLLGSLGITMPAAFASVISLVVTIPVLRVSALALEKIMPNAESSAVGPDSFIGKVATITIGSASQARAAEARLTDPHGQAHYVFLKPDTGYADMTQGDKVLLVRREDNVFFAIPADGELLKP